QPRNPAEPLTPVEQVPDATTAPQPVRKAAKTAIEWVLLIAAALVIALVVKSFFFQAFYIPSDSMVPTLKTDDRVIVNKLSYHLRSEERRVGKEFKSPRKVDP